MEHWYNETDRRKPKYLEKTLPELFARNLT
jgi:hypothetical protein